MNKLDLQAFADELGLQFDEVASVIWGQKEGYTLYIEQADQKNQYRICCSVKNGEALPSLEECKELIKASKDLKTYQVNLYKATFYTKAGMTKGKTRAHIQQGLQDILSFLKERNFTNVCEQTGKVGQVDLYQVGGNLLLLSPEAFQEISSNLSIENQSYNHQKGSILTGTVGAFLGSLIGGIVTLAIAQLGYVAVVSGIVMGVCTIKGYELLGKKLSKVGIAISVVFMFVMMLVAHQFDYAIQLAKAESLDVFTAFTYLTNYILKGNEVHISYWTNLGLLLLFTGAGAVGTIVSVLSAQSQKYLTRKVG
ncbi:hypothetical protein [Streptococcus intermedius]|uniref:Uncharacterized protein n=1 Tax=Streptococcus intermedius TaxID=1338 RepID=A0AAD1FJJ7_STRIT|nr:hypothetical protein [Streptococcus intermedius]RSJ20211.1 hypothetical protein D8829_03590 [Streptococcus intermedius]RSJ21465.1 hypothetical protein D8828_07700 [Streptococcus intermedius]BAW17129.1 hypothetical protein SITYG_11500 [Streptococcus intermedius]